MRRTSLTEALERYARGEISAAEVVALLPPPHAVTVTPRTLESIESDPAPRGRLEAGTWDEITVAADARRITHQQYEELWRARHPR